jgi:Right handed beta helix region
VRRRPHANRPVSTFAVERKRIRFWALVLLAIAFSLYTSTNALAAKPLRASVSAPVNTALPQLSGTAQAGLALTTSTGTWSGSPTFSYQWLRCDSTGAACAAISGATAKSYTLTAAEQGKTLRASVTGKNSSGQATATSAASMVVQAASTAPINVLTDYGTSDTAVRAAVGAAQSQGRDLYFPAGTYTHAGTITLTGLKASGDGPSSVLVASNAGQGAIVLRGNGTELRNMTLSSPYASSRLTTGVSAGIFIDGATNFLLDRVVVDKAGSAGILNYGGAYGTISNSTVRNTLADGIHSTHGAHDIDIFGNTVLNSGDDMFAVVSYESDGVRSHDIAIHGNVGNGETWGRGATVVGGYNVQIYSNDISHTYGAGIYIASEPAWSTYGVDNVTVNGNKIRYPDQGNIHNVNILAWAGRTDMPVTNVTGSGNDLDMAKPGVRFDGASGSIS